MEDPDLTMKLRDRMLVSGLVYERDTKEMVEEIDGATLEEAALEEVEHSLEEVKKRGRPKKQ